MKITVFGKGNVGGGLADSWEPAGHQVEDLVAMAATSQTRRSC